MGLVCRVHGNPSRQPDTRGPPVLGPSLSGDNPGSLSDPGATSWQEPGARRAATCCRGRKASRAVAACPRGSGLVLRWPRETAVRLPLGKNLDVLVKIQMKI